MVGFENIESYDDIKAIVRRALDAEDNYNLLFIGPPASAKTLFLLGILDIGKNGVYFDGSNTTNRILDVLEEERPKKICIDELDKMPRTFQNQLLNFIESGRIKVDQMRRQYDFEISDTAITVLRTLAIRCLYSLRIFENINKLSGFVLLFAVLVLVSVSYLTYANNASAIYFGNGPCPSGEARDYMGNK